MSVHIRMREVQMIMGRIDVAPPERPIAVFRAKHGALISCFGATWWTRRIIDSALRSRLTGLVGVFDREMDQDVVMQHLIDATKQNVG